MCISHFRDHIPSCSFTRWYTDKILRLMYPPKIFSRQRGQWKCLHTSNCLLIRPLKIGQWVYTWINFSAAAPPALPKRHYWLTDGGSMVRQRHQADERAQCNNGQPLRVESATTPGSPKHLLIKGDFESGSQTAGPMCGHQQRLKKDNDWVT